MTTKIDKLVKELVAKRNTEDMSTYAQFFPGIIAETNWKATRRALLHAAHEFGSRPT